MAVAPYSEAFPPLDAATEAALRASIERFGVIVPVVKDQHGHLLDGRHRSRIADDLGASYEIDVRDVKDEEEAREIARTLNNDRRHMTAKQRREVVIALREGGHSYRAIGGALGVSESTAHADLAYATVRDRTVELPDRVMGLDGRSRPAQRPPALPEPPEPGARRLVRSNPTAKFQLRTQRNRESAEAEYKRFVAALADATSTLHGLTECDYGMVVAVIPAGDLEAWQQRLDDALLDIRTIRDKLKEASR